MGSGLLQAWEGQSGKGTVSMAPSCAGSSTLEYLCRWFPEEEIEHHNNSELRNETTFSTTEKADFAKAREH